MRIVLSLLIIVCCAFIASASEEELQPNSLWNIVSRASPDEKVSIVVFLRQNKDGVAELENLLLNELANPLSENYGSWLTSFEVMAYTAPPLSHQLKAARFLESTQMECKIYGDFARLTGTVAQAEALFSVRFFEISHPKMSHNIVRCLDKPVIPEDLQDIIESVPTFGYLRQPSHRYHRAASPVGAEAPSVNYGVVPQTIRQMYNIPSDQVTNPKSSVAVVEFGNSAGISFKDLTTFQAGVAATPNNITSFVGDFIFNPINPDDTESTLDVQYLLALANNITRNGGSFGFWVVPGWIEDFTTLVQARQQAGQFVPYIFSISYGWAEWQACTIAGQGANCAVNNQSEPYVTRTNTELMKIGATGITVIGLSQDAGAASKWNMQCNKVPSVNPSWPGASPYVTTLGATQVLNGQILPGSSISPICNTLTCLNGNSGVEVVCSVETGALITSGGGFSVYAAQPSYQASAVAGFLNGPGLRPPANLFNPANRGEADISLIGHALQIVWEGKWESVDGTSASAPIFAGMVTLWQDMRFNQGKAPLGFLNPLLYTMWANQPNTIRDITLGNNTATEYPNTCTTPGYGAVPGWDPPSGLGVINFANVASYISNLN